MVYRDDILLVLQLDTTKEQTMLSPFQAAHGSKTPRYPRQNGGVALRTSCHSAANANPRWL